MKEMRKMLSPKYAPIRQTTWVEAVYAGLYVALVLVIVDIVDSFFSAHPEYLLFKFSDITGINNQILINKAVMLLIVTIIFGLFYHWHLIRRARRER